MFRSKIEHKQQQWSLLEKMCWRTQTITPTSRSDFTLHSFQRERSFEKFIPDFEPKVWKFRKYNYRKLSRSMFSIILWSCNRKEGRTWESMGGGGETKNNYSHLVIYNPFQDTETVLTNSCGCQTAFLANHGLPHLCPGYGEKCWDSQWAAKTWGRGTLSYTLVSNFSVEQCLKTHIGTAHRVAEDSDS